jgi:hypothetical protein
MSYKKRLVIQFQRWAGTKGKENCMKMGWKQNGKSNLKYINNYVKYK